VKIKRNNIINKIKLLPRLVVFYTVLPFTIFTIIAVGIFYFQKNNIFKDAEKQMTKNLNTLVISVKMDRKNLEDQNYVALNTFKNYISTNKSFFDFETNVSNQEAVNYVTGLQENVVINNWKFIGDSILLNSRFISSLSLSLNTNLIISQKNKLGYINISSTNEKFNLILFPYSTQIVYTIEKGELYSGNLVFNGIEYFVQATPFYIRGKINGMLISLVESNFSAELSDLFGSQVYYQRGYPFVMNLKGEMLVHPLLTGQTIGYSEIYKKILTTQKATSPVVFKYLWPENSKGEYKYMIVSYIENLQSFVGITYFEKDLSTIINSLRILLILAVFMSSLVIVMAIFLISNYYIKRVKLLTTNIENITKGDFSKINLNDKNRLENSQNFELKLVENFKQLEEFTQNLKNFNFNYDYVKWGENDNIGDNLIHLRKLLKKNYEEDNNKRDQQDRIIWLNEGLSKFIEILKYQVIEIKELAYRIIAQIVEYINANEGGFFIVSFDENNEKYLELLATYAMNKEKVVERKILFGDGLIGRVAIEKKTLFLTEIPDSYSKISTSLGHGVPKSIVIIPLLFNDEIIGVVELASFEIFTKLQLDFLEKISENISANLAMWKASRQTAELLRDSQEQAKKQIEQQKLMQKHLSELEKLKEDSEQREIELNSIIKAVDTTALMAEYDTNGMILSANSRFMQTLELSETDLVRKHHRELTSMDITSKEYKDFWTDLLYGNTKRFIEAFNLGDNTIWLSQNYVPILDKSDNVFKILNIAIDISENKILEKQLRAQVKEISKEARTVRKDQRKIQQEREEFLEKEFEYKAIIDGINEFIGQIEFSIDGAIISLNKYFASILGQEITDLVGKNIKDFVVDSDIETFKLAVEKVKKSEQYSSTISFNDVEKKQIKLRYSLQPIWSLSKKIEKIIMIVTK